MTKKIWESKDTNAGPPSGASTKKESVRVHLPSKTALVLRRAKVKTEYIRFRISLLTCTVKGKHR